MQIGPGCDTGQTNFTSIATELDFKGVGTEMCRVGRGVGKGGPEEEGKEGG